MGSILIWVVQSINCDDDEEEQAFATEVEARADYARRFEDGEHCSLTTQRFDRTDRYGVTRTDAEFNARIFNHVFDGWERLEYNPGE